MQKFINLLGEFLTDFMRRGCSCTMDSAYMGQLLAQVACKVWLVNVLGTAQIDRCGPDSKLMAAERKRIKVRSYESVFFYHKTKPLCVAIWGDNNHVTTLSNNHLPRLLKAGHGVNRRLKDSSGMRQKDPTL